MIRSAQRSYQMVSEQADFNSISLPVVAELAEMRKIQDQLRLDMEELKIWMKEWLRQEMKEEDLDPGGKVAPFSPPNLLQDLGDSASFPAPVKHDHASRKRSMRWRRRLRRRRFRHLRQRIKLLVVLPAVIVGRKRFALNAIKRRGKIKKSKSVLELASHCLSFTSIWYKTRIFAQILLRKSIVADLVRFVYVRMMFLNTGYDCVVRRCWDPGGVCHYLVLEVLDEMLQRYYKAMFAIIIVGITHSFCSVSKLMRKAIQKSLLVSADRAHALHFIYDRNAFQGELMWVRAGIKDVHFLPFNLVDNRMEITYIDSDGNWGRKSWTCVENLCLIQEEKVACSAVLYDLVRIAGQIIMSGSFHYPKGTPEMWPDLIQKAKDGGLDVVQSYVCWNGHEPAFGEYYFEYRYDLVRFVKLMMDASNGKGWYMEVSRCFHIDDAMAWLGLVVFASRHGSLSVQRSGWTTAVPLFLKPNTGLVDAALVCLWSVHMRVLWNGIGACDKAKDVMQVVGADCNGSLSDLLALRNMMKYWRTGKDAELRREILKLELFSDYVSLWPTKFQNKINGITPCRWLLRSTVFCRYNCLVLFEMERLLGAVKLDFEATSANLIKNIGGGLESTKTVSESMVFLREKDDASSILDAILLENFVNRPTYEQDCCVVMLLFVTGKMSNELHEKMRAHFESMSECLAFIDETKIYLDCEWDCPVLVNKLSSLCTFSANWVKEVVSLCFDWVRSKSLVENSTTMTIEFLLARFPSKNSFLYGSRKTGDTYPRVMLYLDNTFWGTISISDTLRLYVDKMILKASGTQIDVCVCCASTGSPLMLTLELWPLNGARDAIRYPDDAYDRIWESDLNRRQNVLVGEAAGTQRISTNRSFRMNTREFPPEKAMQPAVVGIEGSLTYRLNLEGFPANARAFAYIVEIEDLQPNVTQKFRMTEPSVPGLGYAVVNIAENAGGSYSFYEPSSMNRTLEFVLSFSFSKIEDSTIGPLMNALDSNRYVRIASNANTNDVTAPEDLKKMTFPYSWVDYGNLCNPIRWDWINCSNTSPSRITKILLLRKNLTSSIPTEIGMMEGLTELWLDDNLMTGTIPDMNRLRSLANVHLENKQDCTLSLVPSAVTWSSLLPTFVRCGRTYDVCLMFNELRLRSVIPTEGSVAVLLSSCHDALRDCMDLY